MTTAEMFTELLNNNKIPEEKANEISMRYGEVTRALNLEFRDTDSRTANTLQVGSYGRYTAIKGISDLDMLYIMPTGLWDEYTNEQEALLIDCRDAIQKRYPKSKVEVDDLIVRIEYTNYHIEVQPVFEQSDRSFKFPDISDDNPRWRITKPRDEIEAMKEFVDQKNKNLRKLCKMARAWKNKVGVGIGGLLVDTLAHRFLSQTDEYDGKGVANYDAMCRDFFKYLSDEPDKSHYKALGSGQNVAVKERFQDYAQTAFERAEKAIKAQENGAKAAHTHWRLIFGTTFPKAPDTNESATVEKSLISYRNTEQFIEDAFPIDIRYSLKIDCEVRQNGFRTQSLRDMLRNGYPLRADKSLKFTAKSDHIPEPKWHRWKVLNRGDEAKRRDQVRGQIIEGDAFGNRKESTNFRGDHRVECYVIKNGVVVARQKIKVPIS